MFPRKRATRKPQSLSSVFRRRVPYRLFRDQVLCEQGLVNRLFFRIGSGLGVSILEWLPARTYSQLIMLIAKHPGEHDRGFLVVEAFEGCGINRFTVLEPDTAGTGSLFVLGQASNAPSMATRTMGALALRAKPITPGCRSAIFPVSVLVPSANRTKAPPAFRTLSDCLKEPTSAAPRLTGNALTLLMSVPSRGILNRVSRAMKLRIRRTLAPTRGGSRKL